MPMKCLTQEQLNAAHALRAHSSIPSRRKEVTNGMKPIVANARQDTQALLDEIERLMAENNGLLQHLRAKFGIEKSITNNQIERFATGGEPSQLSQLSKR